MVLWALSWFSFAWRIVKSRLGTVRAVKKEESETDCLWPGGMTVRSTRFYVYFSTMITKIPRLTRMMERGAKRTFFLCVCAQSQQVFFIEPKILYKTAQKNRDDRTIPIPTSLIFHTVSNCPRPKWRTSKFTGRLHATLCFVGSFSENVDLTIYKKK